MDPIETVRKYLNRQNGVYDSLPGVGGPRLASSAALRRVLSARPAEDDRQLRAELLSRKKPTRSILTVSSTIQKHIRSTAGSSYIWQVEPPKLSANEPSSNCSDQSSFDNLLLTHQFGDYAGDEWVTIAALFQAGGADPDLFTFIEDEDGEVLAIEAADDLPPWMDEGNASGRVLLHRSKLHLVSPAAVPWNADGNAMPRNIAIVAVERGLAGTGPRTLAPDGCQRAIESKIRRAPAEATQQQLRLAVRIPPKAAWALRVAPQLAAHACRALHYRDSRDDETLVSARRFVGSTHLMPMSTDADADSDGAPVPIPSPAQRGESNPSALLRTPAPASPSMVDAVVPITRCLFAQLTGVALQLPKRMQGLLPGNKQTAHGSSVAGEATGASPAGATDVPGDEDEHRRGMYGLRLWAGLEVLAGRAARARRHDGAARSRSDRQRAEQVGKTVRRKRLAQRLTTLQRRAQDAGPDPVGGAAALRAVAEVRRSILSLDDVWRAGLRTDEEAIKAAAEEIESEAGAQVPASPPQSKGGHSAGEKGDTPAGSVERTAIKVRSRLAADGISAVWLAREAPVLALVLSHEAQGGDQDRFVPDLDSVHGDSKGNGGAQPIAGIEFPLLQGLENGDSMDWLQTAPMEMEQLLRRHQAELQSMQAGSAEHPSPSAAQDAADGTAGSKAGGTTEVVHNNGVDEETSVRQSADHLLGGLRAFVASSSDAAGISTGGNESLGGEHEGTRSMRPLNGDENGLGSDSDHSLSDSSDFWYDSDDSFGAPDAMTSSEGTGGTHSGAWIQKEQGRRQAEQQMEMETGMGMEKLAGESIDLGAEADAFATSNATGAALRRQVAAAMDAELKEKLEGDMASGDGSNELEEALVQSLMGAVSEEGRLAGPASSFLRAHGMELPPEWLLAGLAKEKNTPG